MNPEIPFRNDQQIPYGSTYFTGNLGQPSNNTGTVVLGSQAIDAAGNVYTLLQGCVGLQPGDAVLYNLVDFSTVLAEEGAQTGTLYQNLAIYVGGPSNPANSPNLCGYFLTFGNAPVNVLAATANSPVFLSTTPGSLDITGTTQIGGLVFSSNAIGNVANVSLTTPNPTLLSVAGVAPSGPVNATTLNSTGNSNIGSGAGATNTMGAGANSNNTIGGGANSTNNFGTGTGATNTFGEATGTNTFNGDTTFNDKVTVGSLVYTPLVVPDLPAGGPIPAVDNYSFVILQQGSPGQTITVPTPLNLADTKVLFITNSGLAAVTIYGVLLTINESMFLTFDGVAWRVMKLGAGSFTNYTNYDAGTSTGAGSNTLVATAPTKTGALIAGDSFVVITDATGTTGLATLNINGNNHQLLLPSGAAPDMTQITAGYNLLVHYDGGAAFIIDNYPSGSGSTFLRENQTGITINTITVVNPITVDSLVYKNGQLLTPVDDYTIAGQVITLVVTAIATDKFSIIN